MSDMNIIGGFGGNCGECGDDCGAGSGVIALGALGTVTVPDTRVTANTRFLLTAQDGGPAPTGVISQTARVPGVSFTITSSVPGDVGVRVYYQLSEPTIP